MKGGANMFNEVRVYNSQDQLTKIITPQELSKIYWKKNFALEDLHLMEKLTLFEKDRKEMVEKDSYTVKS